MEQIFPVVKPQRVSNSVEFNTFILPLLVSSWTGGEVRAWVEQGREIYGRKRMGNEACLMQFTGWNYRLEKSGLVLPHLGKQVWKNVSTHNQAE